MALPHTLRSPRRALLGLIAALFVWIGLPAPAQAYYWAVWNPYAVPDPNDRWMKYETPEEACQFAVDMHPHSNAIYTGIEDTSDENKKGCYSTYDFNWIHWENRLIDYIIRFGGITTCLEGKHYSPKTGNCEDGEAPVQHTIGSREQLGAPRTCGSVGNPCDAATGNKFQVEVDYRSPDGQFVIERYYNSLSPDAGGSFGKGWRFNLDQELKKSDDSQGKMATAVRPDGREITFGPCIGDEDCPTASNSGMRVNFFNGGHLHRPDGVSELYDAQGVLWLKAHGLTEGVYWRHFGEPHTDYFNHNPGQYKLMSYRDRTFRIFAPTYDDQDRITKIEIILGGPVNQYAGEINYEYDDLGMLSKVTYPDGTSRTYHYEHDYFFNLLTSISDEKGVRYATFTYDASGRATGTEHADGTQKYTLAYNPDDSVTVTDARGAVETLFFEETLGMRNLVRKERQSDGAVLTRSFDAANRLESQTGFDGVTTTYAYNDKGQETSRTEAVGTPEERTTTTEWHAVFHRPIKIVTPDKETTFVWDAMNRLVSRTETDPVVGASRTWSFSWHESGLIASVDGPRSDVQDVTTFGYAAPYPFLLTTVNALGHTTTIDAYDTIGRPATLIDPNGLVTTLTYDARSRLASRTVGGETTTYAYDAAGLVTRITLPDGSFIGFAYDTAQRLTEVADNRGNRTVYTLDALGNRTQKESFDPDDALTRTRSRVFDQLNRLSQDVGADGYASLFTYDAAGNRITAADPLGEETALAYDALNRLTGTVDPLGGAAGFGYDAKDRLTQVTDANGNVTTYAYNGLGDLVRTESPDTGVTTYTHDAAGNVASMTDALGRTTTYEYDALDRLTQATYQDDSVEAFAYDQGPNALGRLTGASGGGATIQWSYDLQGRVTSKTQEANGVTLANHYAYDAAGRLASLTYPSGRVLSFTYTDGVVTGLAIDGDPFLDAIAYRPSGAVAGWDWSGGSSFARTFDLDGRITGHSLGVGDTVLTYDAAGRITGLNDTTANLGLQYDALGRLIGTSGGPEPLTLAYDPNGNRLSFENGTETTAYAYETSSNRLTGETGARVRDYVYDPLGNITADGVHEYIYDLRNRLVSIDNGDVGHYLIGPLGERLWKKGVIPGQAVFDPNGDGTIDKEDLIAVRAARKAFRKYGTFTPEADCTGDGIVIDKADSVCMRQRLRYQRKTTRWSEKTAILSAMLVGKSPDCTGDGVVDEADKVCVKEKVRNARPRRNHIPVIDLAGDCTGDGLLNRDDRICVRRYINISARLVKIAAKVTELESWAASLPYPVTGGGGASQDEEEILFFAYDADGALIGEYDASGAPVRETIRLAGLPVGVISNGVTYRIHPDHLGSPRAITDDVDKVIWRWTGLNPFGLDSADSDPDGDGTKFTFHQRFPGQYFDGESGFHYNHYRDFSPSTGRYVQSDPIGLSGGLNTYDYARGNPVQLIDPDGRSPFLIWGAVIGGGATLVSMTNAILDWRTDIQRVKEITAQQSEVDILRNPNEWIRLNSERKLAVRGAITSGTSVMMSTPGTSPTGPIPTTAIDLLIGGSSATITEVCK